MSEPQARGWRRALGESRTLLTALIALVAAGVGLLFQLVPTLKPDPRERVGAALEIFAVEPQVRFDDWAEESSPNDLRAAAREVFGVPTLEAGQGSYAGTVLYVGVEVDGYKHRTVALRVTLYDARTQRRVRGGLGARVQRASTGPIDSPSRRSIRLLFLPDLSPDPGPQFVRVELVDAQSGAILAVADSATLVHGRVRAAAAAAQR